MKIPILILDDFKNGWSVLIIVYLTRSVTETLFTFTKSWMCLRKTSLLWLIAGHVFCYQSTVSDLYLIKINNILFYTNKIAFIRLCTHPEKLSVAWDNTLDWLMPSVRFGALMDLNCSTKYIGSDILGDGNVRPVDLMRGPSWLRGFRGNEMQRIIRQLKYQEATIRQL
jgi:hypothetical protein